MVSALDSRTAETRRKLIEAAGPVFAEHGYERATVRDICHAAGANVAAINYHFGDKQGLYVAVLKYCHERGDEKFPFVREDLAKRPADERLRVFVANFLHRLLDETKPAWVYQVMMQAMMKQGPALDMLIDANIAPKMAFLEAAVRDLLGRRSRNTTLVRRCCLSVVGQVLAYHFARPVIERLHGGLPAAERDINATADHITAFSLAAIHTLARPSAESAK